MHAVHIQGLEKAFKTRSGMIHALNDINLEIRKGEIFGLLGPNGAGKTTLISILCGATTADKGRATIFEKDITKDIRKIQQEINIVRGFSGVLQNCTVVELLRYYALLYGVSWSRVDEVIDLVGLQGRKEEFVSNFSSGWRQRFFIAKALLNKPRLLLLDEPTVGLDVDVAMQMRKLILDLKREGYTIILTTHYMKEAEELCDRIALISQGRIVAQGTVKELKALAKSKDATLEDVFLKLTKHSLDQEEHDE
jgi:ABC-2 type transport system ATP-binding protein